MSVTEINSIVDFISHISNGLSIVDFTATWCGPCQNIKPTFHHLAAVYTTVKFLQVDVDKNDDISGECGIEAMPTFQVFSNGSKIDELVGADDEELQAIVEKYA